MATGAEVCSTQTDFAGKSGWRIARVDDGIGIAPMLKQYIDEDLTMRAKGQSGLQIHQFEGDRGSNLANDVSRKKDSPPFFCRRPLFFAVLLGVVPGLGAGCAATRRPPVVQEGRVAVIGGDVWYKIVGADKAGVPLLILHGGPGVPHDYLEPLEALADQRPVVFYDQLGCGNSDRPADESLWTVERFVDELVKVRAALKLDRVHILGHSWGTMLAVEYMARGHADGVVSLVLAGPALSVRRWMADQRVWLLELPEAVQLAVRNAEAAAKFDSPEYQAAIEAFYARHVCRLDPWPDFVRRALSEEKMGHAVYQYMWGPSEFTGTGTLKSYERVDRLAGIKTPALFICGRYDEATPAATEYYHRNLPGSEFTVIENASHLSWVEQPELFDRAVRDFLSRSESGRLTPGR